MATDREAAARPIGSFGLIQSFVLGNHFVVTFKRFVVFLGIVSAALAFVGRYVAGQKASGLNSVQQRELLAAVHAAHASTLAAFEPSGEDSGDFEARDARAAADAAVLERAYATTRPAVAAWLLPTVTSFVETVTAAQVQIMAFAINRKNRGLPDSAQADAERDDGAQFKRAAAPLLARLAEVLS